MTHGDDNMSLNVISFIALIIIYFIVIIFTIIKLIDIKQNIKKYEDEKLIKQTYMKYDGKWGNYFRLFKSLSHQYGMITLLFGLILTGILAIIILLINKLLAGNNGYIFMGNQLIGVCTGMFICGTLGMCIIPLSIKKTFFVVATLDLFNVEYRPKIYFRSYLGFLIIFIICFPFIILSCNCYGCYNNKGVYITRYFQIEEKYTSYEEISKVKIQVSHTNNGEIDCLEYIIYLNDGSSININNPNMGAKIFSDSVLKIHEHLRNTNNCEFIVIPLTEEDKDVYSSKLSDEDYMNLLYIFNVNK